MKTQEEDMKTESQTSQIVEAANLDSGPVFDLEAVAVLAYSYWEARGCPHDSPEEDWLMAESELRNRLLPPRQITDC
jgi:hypothetical protein